MARTAMENLVDRVELRHELTSAGELVAAADFDIIPLPGGRSNLTWLVRSGPGAWVLRRPPLGHEQGSVSLLTREVRVLSALKYSALPVPRIVSSWTDERIVGSNGYLMSYLHGLVLEDEIGQRRVDVAIAAQSMIEVLAAVHAVDITRTNLATFGRPAGFLRRRLNRWRQTWSRLGRDLPGFDWAADQLIRTVPEEAGPTLIHGDFRPGNLLVDAGSRISGILDWEMSTLGDPLTDVGLLLAYWEPTNGHLAHPAQLLAPAAGGPGRAQLARMYSELTGRSTDEIDWYVAEEHWKSAAVLQIVHDRYQRGDTVGRGFESVGDRVVAHVESAVDVLEGRS